MPSLFHNKGTYPHITGQLKPVSRYRQRNDMRVRQMITYRSPFIKNTASLKVQPVRLAKYYVR